jgi:hypothetical protein
VKSCINNSRQTAGKNLKSLFQNIFSIVKENCARRWCMVSTNVFARSRGVSDSLREAAAALSARRH